MVVVSKETINLHDGRKRSLRPFLLDASITQCTTLPLAVQEEQMKLVVGDLITMALKGKFDVTIIHYKKSYL
ncbi:MAG: hypothetical protein RLZZ480_636 [Candidatus Parcubacteria bacterium]|jgi:hypothetical protein